jgi:hypothetical protein
MSSTVIRGIFSSTRIFIRQRLATRMGVTCSSARSSPTVSPFASMRTIWWTGIRVPLTQAWP